jgi:hypothetical protein
MISPAAAAVPAGRGGTGLFDRAIQYRYPDPVAGSPSAPLFVLVVAAMCFIFRAFSKNMRKNYYFFQKDLYFFVSMVYNAI